MQNSRNELQYGWVVVAAGALMTCVGVGAMFSLAVFLQPMSESTGWSRAGISSAMTLDFLMMGVAGFEWGSLSDRFGPRPVVLAGSILLGLGLALASRSTSLLQFQITYGALVGISSGSFFAPMMATTTSWFDKHRAIAVALVSAGAGVAPMTISPFAAWLVSNYDWRTAQLTIGIAAIALLVPASLLVRKAPASAAEPGTTGTNAQAEMTLRQALLSTPFIVLALTFFACCATHSGPLFHTVSYAIGCGFSTVVAVTIYSVEGLAGLGGRLLLGVMADRYGAKRILVAGLLVQALAAGSYMLVSQIGQFYAVAAVFGMAYGGVMPLYAVLARQYFGPRIMGAVLGAAMMVSSLGMALGPSVGGWIYDTFHGYSLMYTASLAIGLGAVAIALCFPRIPRRTLAAS